MDRLMVHAEVHTVAPVLGRRISTPPRRDSVGWVEKLAPDVRTIMVAVNARVVKWQTRTFEGRMP